VQKQTEIIILRIASTSRKTNLMVLVSQ